MLLHYGIRAHYCCLKKHKKPEQGTAHLTKKWYTIKCMIQHRHIFNSLLLKESRLKFKNQVSSCSFAFTLLGFFALSALPQKETKVDWVYSTYTELLWWTFAGPWTFWRLETLMPILSRSSSIKDWTLLYRTSLYYIGLPCTI